MLVGGIALGGTARANAQSPAAAERRALPVVNDRLDDAFRKYAKRFFGPGVDWRIFKAQGMTESGLDPDATSRVGARGIMQLMPSTYAEVRSKEAMVGETISDPEWNIAAGILYDRTLWKNWAGAPEGSHQWQFTFGSYNAGLTTMKRAQKIAEERSLNARAWPSIIVVAPEVPRWRHEETITYIDRIFFNLSRMNPNGKVIKK